MVNHCPPECAMAYSDINDIRLFYENDVRSLRQF